MKLSPAAQRICDVAVDHLAERGYDGSSLGEIAELAGLRKASLYSHFASKDSLVFHVLAIATEVEQEFVRDCFAAEDEPLHGGRYLTALPHRFDKSAHLRFLLRTAYAPPYAIRDTVITGYRTFQENIRLLFAGALPDLPARHAEQLTEAYVGAVDSVQVELLYGTPEAVEKRRRALWSLIDGAFASSTTDR